VQRLRRSRGCVVLGYFSLTKLKPYMLSTQAVVAPPASSLTPSGPPSQAAMEDRASLVRGFSSGATAQVVPRVAPENQSRTPSPILSRSHSVLEEVFTASDTNMQSPPVPVLLAAQAESMSPLSRQIRPVLMIRQACDTASQTRDVRSSQDYSQDAASAAPAATLCLDTPLGSRGRVRKRSSSSASSLTSLTSSDGPARRKQPRATPEQRRWKGYAMGVTSTDRLVSNVYSYETRTRNAGRRFPRAPT
jgi:hypothetical protein